MFDNTLSINIGTEADPIDISVVRVNQDGYSSEYRLKEADRDYVFQIRHAAEKNRVKGQIMERHNVTITMNEAPSTLYPQGRTFQSYAVIRVPAGTPADEAAGLAFGVNSWTNTVVSRLLNWES